YTADPGHDTNATFIDEVGADDPLLSVRAGESGTNRGSGGMASKLSAARIASWSGVRAVIADARRSNVLADAVNRVKGRNTVLAAQS
ncbi:MAG: glutamate 5-kinase, partial [Actinobacteria bacterium]|nr:glutamate 5-kinase [Actinomycetota bacterium]